MPTKLIQLEDGTLVEVEVSPDQVQQVSGGLSSRIAEKVSASFDQIEPLLLKVCRPVTAAWGQISQHLAVEHAEVELGLSFEGEGNLYVAKATGSANLKIKLLVKPKRDPSGEPAAD